MGDHTQASLQGQDASAPLDKGKGRAVEHAPAQDVSMGEDGSSSDEEEQEDDDDLPAAVDEEDEEEANEDLEPISTENIISGGRRTRGKAINYAEVAAEAQASGESLDDDDDDDEYPEPSEDAVMKG
ncbi:Histone H2A.Z-specific chaperone [Myotisia sp. PD_48]|nr:Histone H2A.Z-specific chaperone [Myotisia sp. PD_48]